MPTATGSTTAIRGTDPAIFNDLTAELDSNGGGNCSELNTYENMSAQFRPPAEHHDVCGVVQSQ